MPLTNFGAILNFSESIERGDMEFYAEASAASPQGELFAQYAREGKKNLALVQRTRRENVTEMILEQITDFDRSGFQIEPGRVAAMGPAEISARAVALENRAVAYYTAAAEKIKALPEVARALKNLAKKRDKRRSQLAALGG